MSSRRKFIKYILSGIIGFPLLKGIRANYKPKVVVIGGGFGGSTVIKYLKKLEKIYRIKAKINLF